MTHDLGETLYEERVPLAPWLVAFISVVALAMAGTLLVLQANAPASDRPGLFIGAGVTALVVFLAWNYRTVEIRVTRMAFEARYGLFNHTVIPLLEIQGCQPTRARFSRYLGVGVRMGTDGSWAYTTSFGPAVEVRRRSGRPFVVSTNRPQELCQSIDLAAGARPR